MRYGNYSYLDFKAHKELPKPYKPLYPYFAFSSTFLSSKVLNQYLFNKLTKYQFVSPSSPHESVGVHFFPLDCTFWFLVAEKLKNCTTFIVTFFKPFYYILFYVAISNLGCRKDQYSLLMDIVLNPVWFLEYDRNGLLQESSLG